MGQTDGVCQGGTVGLVALCGIGEQSVPSEVMKRDLVHALSPSCLTCRGVQNVRVRFLVKAKEGKCSQVFKGPEVLTVRGAGRLRQV